MHFPDSNGNSLTGTIEFYDSANRLINSCVVEHGLAVDMPRNAYKTILKDSSGRVIWTQSKMMIDTATPLKDQYPRFPDVPSAQTQGEKQQNTNFEAEQKKLVRDNVL